ncbi:hypothetical protein IW261DRAFT_1514037 [Armillaria novae-zelandiae]|uniref:Uncharacterized protein n=1 Tax=Armillaria novae-zelandiae TaxID=153914 RepID=A0AA39NT61_9AGAR|nr:hypothetical protein IW261DRAFT_1514037 [Armillaria novae-zelandiae]
MGSNQSDCSEDSETYYYDASIPFFPSSTAAEQSQTYVDATHRGDTVSIRREKVIHYDNLRTVLHKHFPSLSKDAMIVQTKDFDICNGKYVDIPEELWRDIGRRIHHIKIVTRSTATQPRPGTDFGYQYSYDFYDVDEDSPQSPKQSYIIATMEVNSVFVPRGGVTNYKALVARLVHHFPALVEDDVIVQTSERHIDISPELWPDISKDIKNIKVISSPKVYDPGWTMTSTRQRSRPHP